MPPTGRAKKPTAYVPKAAIVPASGANSGKNSLLKTTAAAQRVLPGSNSLLSILTPSLRSLSPLSRRRGPVAPRRGSSRPDQLVPGRQINVLVVAALGENTGYAHIVGPGGSQVPLDQRPDRLLRGTVV